MATELRRCDSLRTQEGVVVLAEADLVLHLGKAWQGRKGEGRVDFDIDESTDVVEGGEVDASEHAVALDAEVSL